jgi:hypothetical protein
MSKWNLTYAVQCDFRPFQEWIVKAGWFANRNADFNATDQGWWIEQADALIAAAKEEK